MRLINLLKGLIPVINCHNAKSEKESILGIKENNLHDNFVRDVDANCDYDKSSAFTNKEWITNKELIQMYDFRGVKSVKDANWRKKNGFERCISQAGGKSCAVKYSISRINEWLDNGNISKKR